MENHIRKGSDSGDKFSFPISPPNQDDQFEFGCITTPGSPKSPADHLFLNGKLLPHFFPSQPINYNIISTLSRSTSRTSSVCSRDSLLSSRSNSYNSSRSSSCSSARTSISEQSNIRSFSPSVDRKLLINHHQKAKLAAINKNPVGKNNKPPVLNPHYYGSSQRWQFIAPAPASLKQQQQQQKQRQSSVSSRARNKSNRSLARDNKELKTKRKESKDTRKARTWFGIRIIRALVYACKECHAIEPSSRKRLDKN
ncbi:OLC1v1023105C1 [Oldenlandia corymbosa var. corymbosa]|uniref:OLC1v1023105C1 n=1 Tax=Oldenlandia corymbosa var. corymbosa TaxID=529605 RepID=A0AAV1BZP3_OLDCO|nr:OLC1v1023105C1 [Oldenlandia corymbosa var. corymbosa]